MNLIKCPIPECPCLFCTESDKNSHIFIKKNGTIIHNASYGLIQLIVSKKYPKRYKEDVYGHTYALYYEYIRELEKKWQTKQRKNKPQWLG